MTKPYKDCIIHTVPPVFVRIIRGHQTGIVRYDTCSLPGTDCRRPGEGGIIFGALQLRTTDIVRFRELRPVSTWLPPGGFKTRLPGYTTPGTEDLVHRCYESTPTAPRLTADERSLAKGLRTLHRFGRIPGSIRGSTRTLESEH